MTLENTNKAHFMKMSAMTIAGYLAATLITLSQTSETTTPDSTSTTTESSPLSLPAKIKLNRAEWGILRIAVSEAMAAERPPVTVLSIFPDKSGFIMRDEQSGIKYWMPMQKASEATIKILTGKNTAEIPNPLPDNETFSPMSLPAEIELFNHSGISTVRDVTVLKIDRMRRCITYREKKNERYENFETSFNSLHPITLKKLTGKSTVEEIQDSLPLKFPALVDMGGGEPTIILSIAPDNQSIEIEDQGKSKTIPIKQLDKGAIAKFNKILVTQNSNHPHKSILYSEIFHSNTYGEKYILPNERELHWDKNFLDIAYWDKKPAGDWQGGLSEVARTRMISNNIDTSIRYRDSHEMREFMGGPSRTTKVRTCAKTGRIQAIHVIWANYDMIEWQHLKQKESPRSVEKFHEAIDAASKELTKTLTQKFGSPKKVAVGKNENFVVNALDFKTSTGTTLRLYVDEGKNNEKPESRAKNNLLMASIYPTESIQENEYAVVPKNKKNGRATIAALNVNKSPNGDVIITNLPVENGDTYECSDPSILTAMLLEYYGGNLPWEIFNMRENEFKAPEVEDLDAYKKPLHGALADANIKITDAPFSINTIMQEVDAGRPIQANISIGFFQHEKPLLSKRKKELQANQNFRIPKESNLAPNSESVKKWGQSWITNTYPCLITGYNKEKEIVFVTDIKLEDQLPITFSELNEFCKGITTFIPEDEPFERILTDSNGRKVESTILRRVDENQFTFLRKSDGKEFTMKFDQISPEDQEAIKKSFPIEPK